MSHPAVQEYSVGQGAPILRLFCGKTAIRQRPFIALLGSAVPGLAYRSPTHGRKRSSRSYIQVALGRFGSVCLRVTCAKYIV